MGDGAAAGGGGGDTVMMVVMGMTVMMLVMARMVMMMAEITLFLSPFTSPGRRSFVSQQHLSTILYGTVCQVPREIIKVCVIK